MAPIMLSIDGCQRRHRCVRPQIPGLSPGGLGPHLTSSGFPAGVPPVSRLPAGFFPFARLPLVSHHPAMISGVFPSAVARFRFPFGFPPGPLPLSNLHVNTAAGRVPQALVPAGADQGHQFCREPPLDRRDPPTAR